MSYFKKYFSNARRSFYRLGLAMVVVGYGVFASTAVVAASPVISSLKTGDSTSAVREYVAVYNNTGEAKDVSGWCLVYSSASDATKTTLGCLNPPANSKLMLEAWSTASFATNEFTAVTTGFAPDISFAAGISASGGHLRLLDATKSEVDKLGWGSAVSAETTSVTAAPSGKILLRKTATDPLQLIDTNNNANDFLEGVLQSIPASGLYEELLPIDVCQNLAGLQTTVPDDYFLVEGGGCVQDACDNIEGLQEVVLTGYESLDGENCTEVPARSYPRVVISELKPNATGVDDGQEYIELFNPGDAAVNLEGYVLSLGPTFFKTFTLPAVEIAPGAYMVFKDTDSGIVLPNTTASVRLTDPDGTVLSETAVYDNPKDDASWSLIDANWVYSDATTPGAANLLPVLGSGPVSDDTDEALPDCGPGKFRNPETNRCKTIETEDDLKVCAANQERNPETNRCRNILAESGLVPCKEGQERNPETNRCRSVAGATTSSLSPCPVGQERNPETNRCKKTGLVEGAGLSSVNDVESNGSAGSGFAFTKGIVLIAIILILSLAYLIYEWRFELKRILRMTLGKMTPRRSSGVS